MITKRLKLYLKTKHYFVLFILRNDEVNYECNHSVNFTSGKEA